MKTIVQKEIKVNASNRQRGAALLITVVVMLALTILALASTNANQSQALMVRNSQFRFEMFNASYSEIDAQLSGINAQNISKGIPPHINYLIDGDAGTKIYTDAAKNLPGAPVFNDLTSITDPDIEKAVTQSYRGQCRVIGEQLGAGIEKIRCNELQIDASTKMARTEIKSDQSQIFEYRTLAE